MSIRGGRAGKDLGRRSVLIILAIVAMILVVGVVSVTGVSGEGDSCDVHVDRNIQDALNGSAAGDTICVEGGTYEEELTVQTDDVSLVAEDPDDPPVLDGSSFGDDSVGINVSGTTGVTVEGFEVRNYTTSGFVLNDTNQVTLRDNDAVANGEAGFMISDAPNTELFDNTAVDNGESGDTDADGFWILNANGVVLEGNLAEDNGFYGFYVANSHGAEIRNNIAENNSFHGIGAGIDGTTNLASGIVVENNTIGNHTTETTTENPGILLVGLDNPTVRDNRIVDNHRGIQLRDVIDAEIRRNDLENNSQVGVYVKDLEAETTGTRIENNTITAGSWGVYVEDVDDVEIRDNVLVEHNRTTSSSSVYVEGNADDIVVVNNTITDAYTGIRFLDHHEDVVVKNNTVVNPSLHAIEFDPSTPTSSSNSYDEPFVVDPVVVGNEINVSPSVSGSGAIWTSRVKGLHATDNHITNANVGFWLAHSNENSLIEDNVVADSHNALLRIGDGATVRNNNFSDNVQGIELQNMHNRAITAHFEGNDVNHTEQYALKVRSSLNESLDIVFEENDFSHGGGYGVDVDSAPGLTLRNNTITHNDGHGVWVNIDTASPNQENPPDPVIADNQITHNDRGIYIEVADGAVVTGNEIVDNDAHGIYFGSNPGDYAGHNVTVEYNEIADNGDHGIEVRTFNTAPDALVVRHNQIADSAGDGITLNDFEENEVVEPMFHNNSFAGNDVDLRFTEVLDATITKNTFDTGLALDGSDRDHFGHEVVDNAFEDGSPLYYVDGETLKGESPSVPNDAGQVFVVDVDDVSIDGGQFGVPGSDVGILLAYSENATVSNTTVADVDGAAVRTIQSGNLELVDVELSDNGGLLAVESSDGLSIRDSSFVGNDAGLDLSNVANVALLDSEFVENEPVGYMVSISDSPDALVEGNVLTGVQGVESNGLSIGSDGAEVRNNSFEYLDTAIFAGNENVVVDNEVANVTTGLLTTNAELIAKNNTIDDADSYGIHLRSSGPTSDGPAGTVLDSNEIGTPGDAGIYLEETTDTTIRNGSVIGSAGQGVQLGSATNTTVEAVEVRGSDDAGYYVEGDSSETTIRNGTIANNHVGFDIQHGALDVVLHHNDIENNVAGVEYARSSIVDARFNWWGDVSGPSSSLAVTDPETGEPADGSGDSVDFDVRFDPWIDGDDVEPGTLTGTITDSNTGEPIEGATVGVITDGPGVPGDSTGSDGTYEVDSIDPGVYEVNFAADGYEDIRPDDVVITDGETTTLDVELNAVGLGAIAGTVTDEDTGTSVENVAVDIYDADDNRVIGGETDAQGEYEFEMEPGTYRVIIRGGAIGYEQSDTDDIGVFADETTTLDVELTPEGSEDTGTVSGAVTENDGTPIVGATVELLQAGSTAVRATNTTIETGEYRFDVEAGTYDVEVSASGYEQTVIQDVEIIEDETTTRDIELIPESDIIITSADVSSTAIEVGTSVTVTADIENSGGASNDFTAYLVINSTREDDETIGVGPSETETITFEHVFDEPGDFDVTVNGFAAGSVSVSEESVDSPTVAVDDVQATETIGTTVYANDEVETTLSVTNDSAISDVRVRLDSMNTTYAIEAGASHDAGEEWVATVDVEDIPDDGHYQLSAMVTDDAGLTNDTVADETILVDREQPSLSAAITDVDGDNGTIEIRSDTELANNPDIIVTKPDGSNETLSDLNNVAQTWTVDLDSDGSGEYTVETNGTDHAGNEGWASTAVRVDTDFTISDGVGTLHNEDTGTFIEFNSSEDSLEALFAVLSENTDAYEELDADQIGAGFLTATLDETLDENLTSATIHVPVDISTIDGVDDPTDVTLQRYNESTSTWESVNTTVETIAEDDTELDVTGTYWVAEVDGFSTYGAIASDDEPPTITDLTPTDGETLPDGTSDVDVSVEYEDDASGVDVSTVELVINGHDVTGDAGTSITSSETTHTVGVDDGESYTIAFTVADTAGNQETYTHTFTVDDAESETSPSSPSSSPSSSSSSSSSSTPEEPTDDETESEDEESAPGDETDSDPTDDETVDGTDDDDDVPMSTDDETTDEAVDDDVPMSTDDDTPEFGAAITLIAFLTMAGYLSRRQ